MLQTRLVHPWVIYALTLHVQVYLSRPIKDAELLPQGRLELKQQKVYKTLAD